MKAKYILLLITILFAVGVSAEAVGNSRQIKLKGDTCFRTYRYSDALGYFTQGMEVAKKENNNRMYISCLGSIGNVYLEIGDYERSIYYYTKAYRELADSTKNRSQIMFVICVNLISSYVELGQPGNAKVFYRKMMELPAKDATLKNYFSLAAQGLIAKSEKNYSVARYFFKQAASYAKDKGIDKKYLTDQMMNIGDMEVKLNHTSEAIEEYNQCLNITLTTDNLRQTTLIYEKLRNLYLQMGQKDLSNKYNQKYLVMKDSVLNQEQLYASSYKLFDYENKLNDLTIGTLTTHNRNLMAVIMMVGFVLLVVIVSYVLLRRSNHRLLTAQKILVRKNEELISLNDKLNYNLQQYVNKMDAKGTITFDDTDSKKKNDDILLSDEQKERLLSKIMTVLGDIEIISDSEFNLSKLTQLVNSNPKYVSWVINNEYGENFKSTLNKFRIREACRRLTDQEGYGNLTIQAIYKDLGFNNATSFINAFKKETGMTPSTYMKLKNNKF